MALRGLATETENGRRVRGGHFPEAREVQQERRLGHVVRIDRAHLAGAARAGGVAAGLGGADATQVDDKLISLARQTGALVVTNDYNLNRVARLQGVQILNINELANAVKSVLLPGEELPLRIIQEGKESGQGVGYLEDGTMVVVENGRRYLNQEVLVQVTKVLQTNAGRLIFAVPE